MRIWQVYEKDAERPEFVRDGFSWPAFFLVFAWAVYRRLYIQGLLGLAAYALAVHIVRNYFPHSEGWLLFLQLWAAITFGENGNEWVATQLEGDGYRLRRSYAARNLQDAQRTWDALNPEAAAARSLAQKKCPYCAEMIKAEARVCRYCGRDFPAIRL